MRLRDTVEIANVTLGSVPKILDATDLVSTFGKELRMVDAEVLKRTDTQRILAPPTVRIDDAVWRHFALYDGHQRLACRVRDHARLNFSVALKKAKYWDFPFSASPAFTFALTSEITLVLRPRH